MTTYKFQYCCHVYLNLYCFVCAGLIFLCSFPGTAAGILCKQQECGRCRRKPFNMSGRSFLSGDGLIWFVLIISCMQLMSLLWSSLFVTLLLIWIVIMLVSTITLSGIRNTIFFRIFTLLASFVFVENTNICLIWF